MQTTSMRLVVYCSCLATGQPQRHPAWQIRTQPVLIGLVPEALVGSAKTAAFLEPLQ